MQSGTNIDIQSHAGVVGLLRDDPDTILGSELCDLNLLAVSVDDGSTVELPVVLNLAVRVVGVGGQSVLNELLPVT